MLMACNHGEAGWWDARRDRGPAQVQVQVTRGEARTRQDAAPPTGARVSRRAAVHGGAWRGRSLVASSEENHIHVYLFSMSWRRAGKISVISQQFCSGGRRSCCSVKRTNSLPSSSVELAAYRLV